MSSADPEMHTAEWEIEGNGQRNYGQSSICSEGQFVTSLCVLLDGSHIIPFAQVTPSWVSGQCYFSMIYWDCGKLWKFKHHFQS